MMGSELHSWKEIADYLGVTIRTAQRWEKEQGLPVRRLPGERGRVLALAGDLDEWKSSRIGLPSTGASTATSVNASAGAPALPFRMRRPAILVAAILLILVLAAGYKFLLPGQPAQWRIDGATLIVSDVRNREVWRWEADQPLASYLTPEFNKEKGFIWIGDLDRDSAMETLFVPRPEFPGKARESVPLICLDSRGQEKWRFKPGRKISSGGETFPDLFQLDNFKVAPMGKGRPNSILAISLQVPDYPCQVSLLDIHSGKPVREYWHSGHFGSPFQIGDLDQDGVMEIYLAGANNDHFSVTLVVLDPDEFEGASHEKNPYYQLQGFAPGREIRRVIFPRTCVDLGRDIGAVMGLQIIPDGLMITIAPSPLPNERTASLDYYFSPQGKLRRVSPSNGFLMAHDAAHREGKLDHAFSREEQRAFEQAVIILPPSHELGKLGPPPE